MAKGEARYSSEGKTVHRFDNKPIPMGPYELVLQKEGLEVKRSADKGPDAIPYINSRLTALGTRSKPEAKDRLVFHKWFLGLNPGSDGIIMPERGGAIVEYCRSFGEEADFGLKELTLQSDQGSMKAGETVQYFDPEEVLAYLESKVGEPRRAHVIIEPKKVNGKTIPANVHPGDNKVSHWELDEATMKGEAKEETKPAPKSAAKPLPKKK